MEYLETFTEFAERLAKHNLIQQSKPRLQALAKITPTIQYQILLTFEDPTDSDKLQLLLEHEQYKQFKKVQIAIYITRQIRIYR
ncbi:hypothetical protein [Mucilaginibacter sp. PPCGB 2223]|uniref:hypothetical protein n=1 Tax=Mucilaginibacter sp. PPCGB 2223 TaxID=1886027 RepID=UPI00082566DF|nr:hypothetical protein [Mucilaginibacter sp. PPCGB 2223]